MDNRKQSSILKQKVRVPLQEVMLPDLPDDDTVTTTVTRSRRVSFGTNFIKEFIVGSAVSTQCVSEYEHVLSSSDSSRSATASHLFEQSTFASQENIRLSTEGCALNLSMNKSHSENVSVSSKTNSDNRYEFDVDKKQLTARSDIMKQSKNLCDLHLGPEKVVNNKHEEVNRFNNAEKRTKVGKFSSTICFSADSPTADMEFTEGCINLAKSILDKKNQAITVVIKAKPKEAKPEGNETYVFETSDAEMSITKCIEPDGDTSQEKINKSTMDVDDFTDSDTEESDVGAQFLPPNFDGLEDPNRGILKNVFGMDPDTEKSLFSPKKKLNDVFNFQADDSMVENMSLDESQIELNLQNPEATYIPQSEGMELTKCVVSQKFPEVQNQEVFQSSAMDFTKCVRADNLDESKSDSMNMSGCEPVFMEETPLKQIPLNKSHVSFADSESSDNDSMEVTGCLNAPSNPDVNKLFIPPTETEEEKIDSLDDLTESGKRDSVESFVGGLFTGENNNKNEGDPEEDWKLSEDSLETPLETSLADKNDLDDSGMEFTEAIGDKSLAEHLQEKLAESEGFCGNDFLDECEEEEEEKENKDPFPRVVESPESEFSEEEERSTPERNSAIPNLSPEKIQNNEFPELEEAKRSGLSDSESEISKINITPAKAILDDVSDISISRPEVIRAEITPIKNNLPDEKLEMTPVNSIQDDFSKLEVARTEKTPVKNTHDEEMETSPVKLTPDEDSQNSVPEPDFIGQEKTSAMNESYDRNEKMEMTPVKSVLNDFPEPEKTPGKNTEMTPVKLVSNNDSLPSVPEPEAVRKETTPVKIDVIDEEMKMTPVKSSRDPDPNVSISKPEIFGGEKIFTEEKIDDLSTSLPESPKILASSEEAYVGSERSRIATAEEKIGGSPEKSVTEGRPRTSLTAEKLPMEKVFTTPEKLGERPGGSESEKRAETLVEERSSMPVRTSLNMDLQKDLENSKVSPVKLSDESTHEQSLSSPGNFEKLNISKEKQSCQTEPETDKSVRGNRSFLDLTFNPNPEGTEKDEISRSALNSSLPTAPEKDGKNTSALSLTFNANLKEEEGCSNKNGLNLTFNPNYDKSGSDVNPLNSTFEKPAEDSIPLPQQNMEDSPVESDKECRMELDSSMSEEKIKEVTECKDTSNSVINVHSNTITFQSETPHNDRTAATFTVTPKNATYVVPNLTYVLDEGEKKEEIPQKPENVSLRTPEKESFRTPEKESFQTPEKETPPKSTQKCELPVKEAVKRMSVELSPLAENQHKKHRLSSDFAESGIRLVTDVSFDEMDDVTLNEIEENRTSTTTGHFPQLPPASLSFPPPRPALSPSPRSPSPCPPPRQASFSPRPPPSPLPPREDDKMEIDTTHCKSFADFAIGDGKIIVSLTEQSKEPNCLWKIRQLQNSKDCWIFTLDVLQSTAVLEFKIKPSEDSDSYSHVSDRKISLIHEDEYLIDTQLTVIQFGFSKMEKFFLSENKIENVRQISHFLDLLNSFSAKLNHLLRQILSVLEGYPGSSLKDEALSFRLFSFPVLFSCNVIVDMKNLPRLSGESLSFERHFGELNESEVKNIFEECAKSENPLIDFVVSSTKYVIRLELDLGRISIRDHIGLLPEYLKKL